MIVSTVSHAKLVSPVSPLPLPRQYCEESDLQLSLSNHHQHDHLSTLSNYTVSESHATDDIEI